MKLFAQIASCLHLPRHTKPAPAYQPPPSSYQGIQRRTYGNHLLVGLPQRFMRTVATQTETANFAPVPAIRVTPPSTSQIEARRQARADFQHAIDIAHSAFGDRVRFTAVHEDGYKLGYLLASEEFADSPQGPKPVLFVTGNNRRSHDNPEIASKACITTLRASPDAAGHLAAAQNFRRGMIAPGHRISSTLPGYPVPNLQLDEGAVSPSDVARFVHDTGRQRDHAQSVEVFLPAPGTRAHLSTLERVLGASDRYRAIAYSHH